MTPDPDLPKRLPLSPPLVYRYVQGDTAIFTGVDLQASSAVGPWVDVRGAWSYVRAEDTLFDEPLFGIPPFEQRYAVQLHTPDLSRWVELVLTTTADQNRVAEARFEQATEGWTTLDLQTGFFVAEGFSVRGGILNLTDPFYTNHLNSLNPFTGQRIAEVGRRVYVGAGIRLLGNHVPIQLGLSGTEDVAHPAFADEGGDVVMTESRADFEAHRLLPDIAEWDYRRIIPTLADLESCKCAVGGEGVRRANASDLLRFHGIPP